MAISHPNTVAQCPQTPLATIVPCFQVPRVSHSQTIDPPLKMASYYNSPTIKYISSAKLVSHTGAVTVRPNPYPGFKACEKCWLILWLELPVWHQSCLVYLVFLSLSFPGGAGTVDEDCFLYLCDTFLFLHVFQLPCQLFCDSQCSFSPQNIVYPLLTRLFTFTESDRGRL
jgi:hypothetical protein